LAGGGRQRCSKARSVLRSMWPPQIGGSTVRTQVCRTDARKAGSFSSSRPAAAGPTLSVGRSSASAGPHHSFHSRYPGKQPDAVKRRLLSLNDPPGHSKSAPSPRPIRFPSPRQHHPVLAEECAAKTRRGACSKRSGRWGSCCARHGRGLAAPFPPLAQPRRRHAGPTPGRCDAVPTAPSAGSATAAATQTRTASKRPRSISSTCLYRNTRAFNAWLCVLTDTWPSTGPSRGGAVCCGRG